MRMGSLFFDTVLSITLKLNYFILSTINLIQIDGSIGTNV